MMSSLLSRVVVVGLWLAASGLMGVEAREKSSDEKKDKAVSGGLTAGNYERSFQHDGRDRRYLLHIPPGYKPGTPTAVVLAFHGGGSNPDRFRETSDLDKFADEKGFVVVYPAGTGDKSSMLTWNILVTDTYATANKVDDLGFVKKMLVDLEANVTVDKKRLYATGMSQGAMLCYRLACDKDLSARIAAIAPVSGVMTVSPKDCEAARPVPVIHFHGQEDMVIPYAGGLAKRAPKSENVVWPSVATTLENLRKKDGVSDKPEGQQTVGKARHERYTGKRGVDIELWTLEDGGHTWPGGNAPAILGFVLGKTNRDISANEKMWAFFEKHPLP